MKKSTLILLILGFIFVLFGGIATAMVYPRAEKEAVTNYKKDYVSNSDTLYLNVNTSQYFYLYSSDSEKLQVRSTYFNFSHPDLVTEYKKATNGDMLTVSTQGKNALQGKKLLFNGFFNENQELSIGIPRSVKHLVLTGGRGQLDTLTLTSLKIKGKADSDCTVSNLITDKLIAEGNHLNLSLDNSLVEDLTFKVSRGEFSSSSNKINHAQVTSEDLTFSTYESVMNQLEATLAKGSFILGKHQGNVTLNGDNVSVNLENDISGNLNLAVKRGDIMGSIYDEESQPQATITAETKAGKVNLFGHASPYKLGKGTYDWQLKTSLGNITFTSSLSSEDEKDIQDVIQ